MGARRREADEARRLQSLGWTIGQIAAKLGVNNSAAWRWVTYTSEGQLTDEERRLVAEEAPTGPPATYGECPPAGPCPYVSCRHHLYLDVNESTGAITINYPKIDASELVEPCSLRIAAKGKHGPKALAEIFGLTGGKEPRTTADRRVTAAIVAFEVAWRKHDRPH